MIKVYFTASTTQSDFTKNYQHILKALEKMPEVEVISGKQVANSAILKKDKTLSSEKIFQREKSLLDKADIVIAEVTQPSTGMGGEIVYALIHNKPVFSLIYEENEDELTPMLEGNPSDYLFIEHYTLENLHLKLKEFIAHATRLQQKKGKLIVIDGGDGSGKATQAKLLIEYLKKKKFKVKYMDFPQYYSSFHGKTVAMFLRGEFGELNNVSPYLASLAYASDRASVKEEMEEFLESGGIIIANRYATSNMAHQAAKIKDDAKRKEFLNWVYDLEYKIHKIPKEDAVVYLYVPWKVGYELTKGKDDRKYLKGNKQDIQESDTNHRQDAEHMYLHLAQEKNWIKIDCVKNDVLLPIETIHSQILSHLTFI